MKSPFAIVLPALPSVALLIVSSFSQITPATQSSAQTPVSYASVTQLNELLAGLEQTSQSSSADLAKLRIDRWKTDSSSKKQAQADVDSVLRNLQGALPNLIRDLRAAPEDIAATFKLYHNLDALHDVLRSVAETAGAFGARDEYQPLANDANALDNLRRNLADRLQNLAAAKEAELAHLRSELKAAQAAPPPPPKKIVVDDNQPAPKKAVKKKAAPKTAQPGATTQTLPPAPQAQQ